MSIIITRLEVPDGSITEAKLADGSVTPSKASASVKRNQHVVNSQQFDTVSTTFVDAKIVEFVKNNGSSNYTAFAICSALKTDNAAHAASIQVIVDAEGAPRSGATASTNSTTFDIVDTGDVDISDLANGTHTLKIQSKSADASANACLRETEVFFVIG